MARRVAVGEEGAVSAVVVAVAAMERLGWVGRLTDVLDPMDVLPQAGQGAIAVQCRADDEDTRRPAARHRPRGRATAPCVAERAVLAALGGAAPCRWGPSPRSRAAVRRRVAAAGVGAGGQR